jgi:sulfide:quinone oxidoreductase
MTELRSVGSRPRVVIAGGGVAAVEAVLALRDLVGRQIGIDMLVPERVLAHRPSSVATPFGFGGPPELDLAELGRRHAVTLHHAGLASVDADAGVATVDGGAELPYDFLLLAHGARAVEGIPGAITFRGAGDAPVVERSLDAVASGAARHIVVAVPPGSTWPLPAYELVLLAAADLRSRGAHRAALTLVTPERAPLWLFGRTGGEAIADALRLRGIDLRTNARADAYADGALRLATGEAIEADAVIALPVLEGNPVPGLPHDDRGFIPTDAHGRVAGVERVFASGDATAFPIKQGGLATQQADAAAAAIAAAIGAIDQPAPFRPVLRGLLLTGGAPVYLRAELDTSGEPEMTFAGARRLRGEVSSRALWWPPGKIAGRYLAPYLADARAIGLDAGPMRDRTAQSGGDTGASSDAVALALMLAEEDAAAGDHRMALEALEAAASLRGGVLPTEYAELRKQWIAELD